MNISYNGIGAVAATFQCGTVSEGDVVKISANNTVASCSAGNAFCGVVVSSARSGDACAVQLGGIVTVVYSGTAPTVGESILAANGTGGVKTAESGKSYTVIAVDTTAKTATIVL